MNKKNWDKINVLVDKAIEDMEKMSPKELEELFPRSLLPHGWISIEDNLPQCMAEDFIKQGYSIYKVKTKDGDEFEMGVCDHNIWYYDAKEIGVTHWWNDNGIKNE